MPIILAYLALCLVLSFIAKQYPKTRLFVILTIFFFGVIISGYRRFDFTEDNLTYIDYFIENSKKSLSQSWQEVLSNSDKDPFYYFLGNVFSKLGFTYRGWFVFIAAVYMGGFCYITYKYSKDYFISVLILVTQSYFYFSMTGLRQTLAMGVCFFAYDFAVRRKPIKFVLAVFLAYLFHSSALIFAVFYFIKNLKINYKYWFAAIIALAVSFLYPSFINNVVERLAWSEEIAKYADSTTGLTISGFIIQFCILLFCYVLTRFDAKNDTYRKPWFAAMVAGLVIQAFAVNIDNIFRMAMYFSVYGTLAVPDAIELQEIKSRRLTFWIITAVLMLYFLQASKFGNFKLQFGV